MRGGLYLTVYTHLLYLICNCVIHLPQLVAVVQDGIQLEKLVRVLNLITSNSRFDVSYIK